jgi:hypothetical protein
MSRLLVFAAIVTAACQGSAITNPAAESPPAKAPVQETKDALEKVKAEPPGPGSIEVKHAIAWLKAYMELGEALVHSHAVKAAAFAHTMAAATPPQTLHTLLAAFPSDLEGQRFRFAEISAELHKIWLKDTALQASTVVMHCPMVPADWVQPAGILRNPYMPKTMLHCGYQVAPKK